MWTNICLTKMHKWINSTIIKSKVKESCLSLTTHYFLRWICKWRTNFQATKNASKCKLGGASVCVAVTSVSISNENEKTVQNKKTGAGIPESQLGVFSNLDFFPSFLFVPSHLAVSKGRSKPDKDSATQNFP